MFKDYDPFFNILPKIDVHGLHEDMIICVLNDFISDNLKLNNKTIIIIHGKGTGVLKRKIHELLKRDKRVKNYYIDNYNTGQTVIELI